MEWREEDLTLLGTAPDTEVAERLEISEGSVRKKRKDLGIPASSDTRHIARTAELVEALHLPNPQVCRRTGLHVERVRKLRKELAGIKMRSPSERRWTPEILARLGEDPDAAIAAVLGITAKTVAAKREGSGIPSPRLRRWTEEEKALVGTAPDLVVARRVGRSEKAVAAKRQELGILCFGAKAPPRRWTPEEVARLGTAPDEEIAARTGWSVDAVKDKRRSLGLLRRPIEAWRPEEVALFGTVSDAEIATRIGRSVEAVRAARWRRGIPPVPARHGPTPARGEEIALLWNGARPRDRGAHRAHAGAVEMRRLSLGIYRGKPRP